MKLVPRLLDRDDWSLGSPLAVGTATVKRVIRHLPFRDAAFTEEPDPAQNIAGAKAGQLSDQSRGEGIRRLVGLEGNVQRFEEELQAMSNQPLDLVAFARGFQAERRGIGLDPILDRPCEPLLQLVVEVVQAGD